MATVAVVSMSAAAHGHGRWIDIQNNSGCAVWIEEPADGQTVTWTGPCVDGRAQGSGVLTSTFRHGGET
ncbi:MAG: hypothetical protein E4H30_08290, partial [Methanomassiliicoccus sp.]